MSDSSNAVTIQILGKDYLVACSESEKKELQESAGYLDQKMREIRDTGKVVGTDRVAVMAALNIAHELLYQGSGSSPNFSEIEGQIDSISSKIEAVLNVDRQLELEA